QPDNPFDHGTEEMAVAASSPVLARIDRGATATVQIRELTTGATTRSIELAPEGHHWLALTPDGRTLATASRTCVRCWDTTTGRQLRTWPQRADGRPVFSPDGRRLAWTGFDNGKGIAQLWSGTREDAAPQKIGTPVNNFEPPCFSPGSDVLAVVTD